MSWPLALVLGGLAGLHTATINVFLIGLLAMVVANLLLFGSYMRAWLRGRSDARSLGLPAAEFDLDVEGWFAERWEGRWLDRVGRFGLVLVHIASHLRWVAVAGFPVVVALMLEEGLDWWEPLELLVRAGVVVWLFVVYRSGHGGGKKRRRRPLLAVVRRRLARLVVVPVPAGAPA